MTNKLHMIDAARPFLAYLEEWYEHLPGVPLAEVLGSHPDQAALISVDMINGFCKAGPLASERVGALAAPVADLFQRAYDLGVRALVFTQDTHDPNTPEFAAYPPHCIAGTAESDTIAELKNLPFASEISVVPKNSLSSHIGTSLDGWMADHPALQTFIIVGDCTDLCVYSAAMHLRMQANAHNLQRRVIVPASAVDTFDTPVSVARSLNIKAHEAMLHHVLFLHHMSMNGVEVVKELA